MGTYLLIAARNLLQARLRTFFLSLVLGAVTALLVLLLGLSRGLSETIVHTATVLASGHVNVGGFFKGSETDANPILNDTPTIRKIVEENTPNLDYVVDRSRGWARVVSLTTSLDAGLYGIDISEERKFAGSLRLAEERSYKDGGRAEVLGDPSRLSEPHTVLLFAKQAKRLGISVGDQVTLSAVVSGGSRNTSLATVVAVAKDVGFMSDWYVFVPKSTIIELYQQKETTSGSVLVYLKGEAGAETALEHLRGVFKAKGYELMDHEAAPFFMKFDRVAGEDWRGQKLDLTTWSDEVSFVTWVVWMIDIIAGVMSVILFLIIAVGIWNTMTIAIRERTGEIGTLRAIGMGRGQILVMFLVEAFLLGLFATTIGGLLGWGLVGALDAAQIPVTDAAQMILMSDNLDMSIGPGQIVATISIFTLITALSALWPALRAAWMPPVTAIQRSG